MSLPILVSSQERLNLITALLVGDETTVQARRGDGSTAYFRIEASEPFEPTDEEAALRLLVAVRELVGDHLAMRVIAMSDIENRLGRSLGGDEKAAVSASGGWRTFHYLGPNTGLEIGRILDSCGIR